MTTDLILYLDDFDDEGTLYHLTGRGPVLSTYCVLTIRAAILARLTAGERDDLREQPNGAPEHFVLRIIRDGRECGDPDYDDPGAPIGAPWAA